MANIPIRDMTQTGTPDASSQIVFDNGVMRRGTVGSMADAVRPVASQSEAQVGSDNSKTMTPLRVKDSIAAEVGGSIASTKDPVFSGNSPTTTTISAVSGSVTGYMQALSAGAVLMGTSSLTPLIFVTNGVNRGTVPAASGDWLFGNPTVTQGTISLAGATSGSVKIQGAAAAVGTWTLPNATDTFVGQAATATLTNKTFDTAGTGNSLLINGLAATANTGTGAVVRATSPTLVTPNLGTPSAGIATNLTGTAAGLTAGNVTTNANLTGEVTSVGNATTLTNSAAIGKVLTGFTSGAGTVTAADSILSAFQKLNGNDALKAPLASPALTGTPTVPTAAPGTNTTQAASTAFVQAAVTGGTSGVASLNGQTGALVAFFPPQGRLTLVSATPVMGSSVAGSTAVFYTPFAGNMVPLYDGSNLIPTVVAEIAQATTDTTKSPAAVAANSVYDLFVWNDGGTIRLSRGPAWTNDTTRSAGTALTIVNGIALNSVSITNGPAASRGTYVGTVASNASSTIDFIYGGLGAGGVAAVFGVWNAYNRALITTTVKDSNANWTYTVANTWRAPDAAAGSTTGSTTYRVTAVRGSDVDYAEAYYSAIGIAGASSSISSGIGLDSTTTPAAGCFPGFLGSTPSSQQHPSSWTGLMGLGRHYLTPLEFTSTTTAGTFLGTVSANIQAGFKVSLWQ